MASDIIDILNATAHWHYEALRTWGDLMARQRGEAQLAVARDAKIAQEMILKGRD